MINYTYNRPAWLSKFKPGSLLQQLRNAAKPQSDWPNDLTYQILEPEKCNMQHREVHAKPGFGWVYPSLYSNSLIILKK